MKRVNVNRRRSTHDRMRTSRNICTSIYQEYTTMFAESLNKIMDKISKDIAKIDKTFRNYQLGEMEIYQKFDKVFERHWKITSGNLRKSMPQIKNLWRTYLNAYVCFEGFGGKDKDLLKMYKGIQKAVEFTDNQVIEILLDIKRLKGETAAHDPRALLFILNEEHLEELYT